MQTTLLGLALAIILALVAALVGPLLIDWGTYRSAIDREASRLVGLDVHVTGAIDARLLPSPRMVLHDIEIGRAGEGTLRARSLGIEFALAPLLRGEWRASDMALAGLDIRLGLDVAGHVQVPNIALRFNADALSIDRLSITDSRIELADAASGASIELDNVSFNGEMRSLFGPFKGEGALSAGGALYSYRVSAGRIGDDGALKLHVNVDPAARPLGIEADGTLTLAGGTPQFDGTLSVSRPAGIASQGGALMQPWQVSGKVKASAASVLMEQIEFQYGSEDLGAKLTGTAEFKFGPHPRFDGVLSGRQINLDRALAESDASPPSPVKALRALIDASGGGLPLPIPVQIGIGIDEVTLGGNTIQTLRGDISGDAQGWSLDRFEFRAPGFTHVRFSGRVAADGGHPAFNGPADIQANDPLAFAAWLQGRPAPQPGDTRPLRLRGDMTLSREKVAIEHLDAEFDRKPITGRFAYVFGADGHRPQLDTELKAADLDVDAALGLVNALVAGSNVERPHDIALSLDIARATVAGMAARDASARLTINGDGLQIDRLSVADLGGVTLSGSGRIDTGGGAPHGALVLDMEAQQTSAIAALVTKFAPNAAASVTPLLDRFASAKLHATLGVDNDKDATSSTARLTLAGNLDAMTLGAKASVAGNWLNPSAADIRVDATLDAPDGAALLALTGLDPRFGGGKGAGKITMSVSGPVGGDLALGVRLTAGSLMAESSGSGRISMTDGLHARGNVQLSKASFNLTSPVVIAGRKAVFDGLTAQICGSSLRGRLDVEAAAPLTIDGALNGDSLDVPALVRCIVGVSADDTWRWSAKPFGPFAAMVGRVTLKAKQAQAAVKFGSDEIVLEDLSGDLAGGHVTGHLSLRNTIQGIAARAHFALTGADAAQLDPAARVTGQLDTQGNVEGSGLTPLALIGSLHGAGTFKLSGAHIAGLDPHVFDAVIGAVDKGLQIEPGRIAAVASKVLDGGSLAVKEFEGDVSISAGQVRLNSSLARGEGADATLGGTLDLTDGAVDARLALSGSRQDNGARPRVAMSFKGPISAPVRTLDVSALTDWLMLRSIEDQTKRLQAIEGDHAAPATKPGKAPAGSVSPQH